MSTKKFKSDEEFLAECEDQREIFHRRLVTGLGEDVHVNAMPEALGAIMALCDSIIAVAIPIDLSNESIIKLINKARNEFEGNPEPDEFFHHKPQLD